LYTFVAIDYRFVRILLVLLLLLFSLRGYPQLQGQDFVDSLLKQLPKVEEDTVRVKCYQLLANAYKTIDPNIGIKYGQLQLELARKINSNRTIASAYDQLGLNYYHKSDYTTALEYFNKALSTVSLIKHPELYCSIISHIAVVYQELGNHDKALEYNLKILEYDKKEGKYSINVGCDYGNIGIIYMQKNDLEKSLEYAFMSLEVFKKLEDKDGIAHNYGNIGNVYKVQKKFRKALESINESSRIFEELGDNAGIAINLGNIGGIYLAIAVYKDSNVVLPEPLPSGSKTYFLQTAISYFNKSIEISKEIEQLENIKEFSHGLVEAYTFLGNYKMALESYKQHITYRDSITSTESKMRIANLETEREYIIKEKELQIEKLEIEKKRNERIILIITVVLLLIVIGIIVQKFLQQKKRNIALAVEKEKHLARIAQQKKVMNSIAHTHAHEVSGQVSTILGLVSLFNNDDYADPDNKTIIDGIAQTAEVLDNVVKDMIKEENRTNNNNQF
jgi:tetratricopeptide (TPR) repeat protein